ncbi:transposase [Pontibacter russatus]|uniref:transposase n=1 Tax=Pontibacter russatus TaxID=2694929 RepID=UPI00137B60B6|nr:transposase [Pontibacter russatus]
MVENQSGKMNSKAKISKHGNSHTRKKLYMPALALKAVSLKVRICRALYERLTGKGKKKMIVYMVVQKKLLILIYTLWKKDETWS